MAINIPSRNFNDIVNDSKNYLINNSKIKNLTRTSTAKLLLDAVAFEQASQYDSQRYLFLNSFLSTAQGSYLDEIGYLFNCTRKNSQKSVDTSLTNFRFFIDPTFGNNIKALIEEFYTVSEIQDLINAGLSTDGTNLVIPTNVKITNMAGNIIYYTDSSVTIGSNNAEGFAPVSSAGLGQSYNVVSNVLSRHNLSDIPELRKISNFILCENKFGISTGEGYETDEAYRWRISNKVVGNASANETAIRLAAFAVPGVRTISIIPKAYGVGTFRVFVEGVNPIINDGLLNAVKENILRSCAIGENVYVTHPTYIGVEMQIQLLFDYNANRNLLKESARSVIIDYVNNIDIGGEIIINEIIQRVMQLSDQIKDMNFTLFGYGNYNKDTLVNEDFTPLRLTNQTARWNEKFYTNNKMCSLCEFGSQDNT